MGNEDKYRIYKWQIRFLVITPLFLSLVFFLVSTIRGANRVVTISAVGDTNGYNLFFDASNQVDPIQGVKSLLVDSDVFLFNYEGVILPREPEPGECHSFPRQSLFYTTPQIVNFLRPVPLAVAGIANNHILDCGSSGIRETIGALKSNGILTVGAGKNTLEACSPVLLEMNGYKIAVVAYLEIRQDLLFADSDRAGAASWKECDGERQVGELKASGRIVIVSLHLHMGREWTESPPQSHIDLVRGIMASGADVIIAHGPHVLQGVLRSGGRLALLSAGNFLFRPDYRMPKKAHSSLIAKITISSNQITLALLPLMLDSSGKPEFPTSEQAFSILRNIAYLSTKLETNVVVTNNVGYVTVE